MIQAQIVNWQTLLHNIDWVSFITRIIVGLIFATVLFIARYIWKLFKNQHKSGKEIKELEAKVESYDVSLRALGTTNEEYRRSIQDVLRNNQELRRRVDALEKKVADEEERFRRRISELETENLTLKKRVTELEAINQVEPIRRRQTDELQLD